MLIKKLIFNLKFFVIFYLLALNISHAGNAVGDGGDSVFCHESQENSFHGHYSLDYLLSYQQNDVYISADSYQNSLNQILEMLKLKAPGMAESLEEFISQIKNTDYSKKRVWEEAPFGLIDIQDEHMVTLVPKNCKNAEGKISITQTVIRQFATSSGRPESNIVYKYIPNQFDLLNSTSPLQLSHVLIHEWLWDLSRNVDRNRRINRFLHLKATTDLTKDDFQAQLLGMGLIIPRVPPPLYNPQICMGNIVKDQDIQKYLTTRGNTFESNIGRLQTSSRYRTINCDRDDPLCDSSWQNADTRFPQTWDNPFGKNIVYSFFSWNMPGARITDPIQIVVPDNFSANGRRPLLKCNPKDDNSWHCKILSKLEYSGFSNPYREIDWDRIPEEQHPAFNGVLREDCLWLMNKHEYTGWHTGRPHYRREVESVIYGTLKWPKIEL